MVLRLLFNLLLINCPAINIIASTYLKRNGRKWQPLSSSTLSTKDCIEKEGQKWRRRTCQTVIMCKAILIDMMLNSYFSLGNYFSVISIFTLAILRPICLAKSLYFAIHCHILLFCWKTDVQTYYQTTKYYWVFVYSNMHIVSHCMP